MQAYQTQLTLSGDTEDNLNGVLDDARVLVDTVKDIATDTSETLNGVLDDVQVLVGMVKDVAQQMPDLFEGAMNSVATSAQTYTWAWVTGLVLLALCCVWCVCQCCIGLVRNCLLCVLGTFNCMWATFRCAWPEVLLMSLTRCGICCMRTFTCRCPWVGGEAVYEEIPQLPPSRVAVCARQQLHGRSSKPPCTRAAVSV